MKNENDIDYKAMFEICVIVIIVLFIVVFLTRCDANNAQYKNDDLRAKVEELEDEIEDNYFKGYEKGKSDAYAEGYDDGYRDGYHSKDE